jgi:putative aldouronate transport system permease protein
MNRIYRKKTEVVFEWANIVFLLFSALLCLFPVLNVLALSLSSSTAATAGYVKLWPVDFTLKSYEYALEKQEFITSFIVSIQRVLLGAVINMGCTILAAYPLSQNNRDFPMRTAYAWFFFFTMIFSGGLIPWYLTIKQLGLIDTLWAVILPGALPVFHMIILLNFFRQLPHEISESAFVDGAGHFKVMLRIYLPLSTPSLATLLLFTCVGHWNSWFDGMILMNSPQRYPLQTYLRTIVVNRNIQNLSHATKEELEMFRLISDRTTKASQIFIAALPILAIYPFLQKYFVKGIVMGSVKG